MTKKSDTPAIRFKGFTDTWEQRKLGELGTITTGSTPSTSIPDYYSDDGIVWVTPTDICENITFESARKLSDLGQQVGRVVPKNTILVTCIASIGKNTMLGNTGSFNQQINGLTPNENECDPYFLLTESALWSAKMKSSAAAGTMQIVNRTEFSELKTWLPSLIEQQAISDFFRQLDNLITLHQRKYDKLTNVKKSMLEKMFPKNGSNVPEIRFKGFTEAWEQRKLLEFGLATGGTSIESEFSEDGVYKVISIGSYSEDNVYRDQGIRAVRSDKTVNRILNKGDITMILNDKTASGNIIGRVLLIEESGVYVYNQRTERIEVDNSNYDSQFIYTMLNAPAIRDRIIKQSQGNTQIYVNWTTISQTDYLVPQFSEQRKIGEYFANLDHLITLHQRELEKLKNIKKSCLENMFV